MKEERIKNYKILTASAVAGAISLGLFFAMAFTSNFTDAGRGKL